MCRAEYTEVAPVPPLSSTTEWFELMDVDGNGLMDQHEVLTAMAASLPADQATLEVLLPELWAARGKLPEDALDPSELLGSGGLVWQMRQVCVPAPTLPGPEPEHPAPSPELGCDREAWFRHWDTNGSGVLERGEVVRGLNKDFQSDVPVLRRRKRLRMRCVVEALWPLVDADGDDRIDLEEFSRPGGLADLIQQRFKTKDDLLDPLGRMPVPRAARRRARTGSRKLTQRGQRSWTCDATWDEAESWEAPDKEPWEAPDKEPWEVMKPEDTDVPEEDESPSLALRLPRELAPAPQKPWPAPGRPKVAVATATQQPPPTLRRRVAAPRSARPSQQPRATRSRTAPAASLMRNRHEAIKSKIGIGADRVIGIASESLSQSNLGVSTPPRKPSKSSSKIGIGADRVIGIASESLIAESLEQGWSTREGPWDTAPF